MTMSHACARAGALLLIVAGCTGEPAGVASGSLASRSGASHGLAGSYPLTAVDERPLPCCAQLDSSGARVDFLGGTLTLAPAAPERYAYPPSGVPMPVSCIHEIPNGARVDTADVVHLPDGSSYKLPRCGDAPYTLVLSRRYTLPDGTARTVVDSASGLYAWGYEDGGGWPALISLVDSGMGGAVADSSVGLVVRVAKQHIGPRMQEETVFEFTHR